MPARPRRFGTATLGVGVGVAAIACAETGLAAAGRTFWTAGRLGADALPHRWFSTG